MKVGQVERGVWPGMVGGGPSQFCFSQTMVGRDLARVQRSQKHGVQLVLNRFIQRCKMGCTTEHYGKNGPYNTCSQCKSSNNRQKCTKSKETHQSPTCQLLASLAALGKIMLFTVGLKPVQMHVFWLLWSNQQQQYYSSRTFLVIFRRNNFLHIINQIRTRK